MSYTVYVIPDPDFHWILDCRLYSQKHFQKTFPWIIEYTQGDLNDNDIDNDINNNEDL